MEIVYFPHPASLLAENPGVVEPWVVSRGGHRLWEEETEVLLDTSTVLCNKVGYHLILERVTPI